MIREHELAQAVSEPGAGPRVPGRLHPGRPRGQGPLRPADAAARPPASTTASASPGSSPTTTCPAARSTRCARTAAARSSAGRRCWSTDGRADDGTPALPVGAAAPRRGPADRLAAHRRQQRRTTRHGRLLVVTVGVVEPRALRRLTDADGRPTTPAATAAPTPRAGCRSSQVADLPPEAADTLDLIDAGGPFPEDRDGVTFENREDLLPDHPWATTRSTRSPLPAPTTAAPAASWSARPGSSTTRATTTGPSHA